MYNRQMYELGSKRSVIRELFEYGKKRAAEMGADKVYDFSLGNPNIPAPPSVKDAIISLVSRADSTEVHGYTSAQGDAGVRKTVADYINSRFGTSLTAGHIYMTAGAAASLSICLNALNEGNDQFITFAPYFPEYKVFTQAAGGKLTVIPVNEADFQIDFKAFESALSEQTKAIIINSPNNPSGVVYSEDTILKLCAVLKAKSEELGRPIYLISDEPYREIVYDGVKVPYLMNYYANTLVCYSYSKSLSLPGERIGYIALSPDAEEWAAVYAAICGAGRALGYVCAPSMFQKVVEMCINQTADISAYKYNRDLLYGGLTELGYKCVRPDGAFYLFVKSLEEDANAFCERAKKYGLLVVPGDDFGAPGYVRIAYCVSADMIKRALPEFAKLKGEY